MPQTSPINWMTTSLIMIFLVNTCSQNSLMSKTKNNRSTNSKNMKNMKWMW